MRGRPLNVGPLGGTLMGDYVTRTGFGHVAIGLSGGTRRDAARLARNLGIAPQSDADRSRA
jgi:hypothetical protein